MRRLLAAVLLTTSLAAPAMAQDANALSGYTLSFDAGLGVKYGPSYFGSDEGEASPWLILRNGMVTAPGAAPNQPKDGFSILPSIQYIAPRKAKDHELLTGTKKIGHTGELGLRMTYEVNGAQGYVALRKGFGGHDGYVGEAGAKYSFKAADRLWMWTSAEARFGSDDFTETYFGVSDADAATSVHAPYDADGGLYAASVGVGARYSLTPELALLGEVEYIRLLSDAADSPLVASKGEPRFKLGVVRRFDFRF